jgi:hypothetical protein
MKYAQHILSALANLQSSINDLGHRLEAIEQANQLDLQLAAPVPAPKLVQVNTPVAQDATQTRNSRSTLTSAEKKQKYAYAEKYIKAKPELIADVAEMRANNKPWSRISPLLSKEYGVPPYSINHAYYLANAQGAVVNNQLTEKFEALYL